MKTGEMAGDESSAARRSKKEFPAKAQRRKGKQNSAALSLQTFLLCFFAPLRLCGKISRHLFTPN
jgi:hypothetical protein